MTKITRIIVLILDGLGVGPSAGSQASASPPADTLSRLCQTVPTFQLPNLRELGLGHVGSFSRIPRTAQPAACFGRLAPSSAGVGSLIGHWELTGLVWRGGGEAPRALSDATLKTFQDAIGRSALGNKPGTQAEMLAEFGEAHLRTGWPILYLGPGADCHVAMHERTAAGEELVRIARALRAACKSGQQVLRVLAHAFTGEVGKFAPAIGERLFVLEPPGTTVLDLAKQGGHPVAGIGRMDELFAGRGLTRTIATSDASNTMEETIRTLAGVPRGLIVSSFAGQFFGQAGTAQAAEAAKQLEEFDMRVPDLLNALKSGDLLCITADYGATMGDLELASTPQCVPLLAYGLRLANGVNLGTRKSMTDLGQTLADALETPALSHGDSFLDALRVG